MVYADDSPLQEIDAAQLQAIIQELPSKKFSAELLQQCYFDDHMASQQLQMMALIPAAVHD